MDRFDFDYIERILNLRQDIYDNDPNCSETISKIKCLDDMFQNFMSLNYKIDIKVNITDNKYDILS